MHGESETFSVELDYLYHKQRLYNGHMLDAVKLCVFRNVECRRSLLRFPSNSFYSVRCYSRFRVPVVFRVSRCC